MYERKGEQMNFDNMISRLQNIVNHLADEESKIIFNAKINYMCSGEESVYYKELQKIDRKGYCPELDEFMRENKDSHGIIIYGAREEGDRTKRILEQCDKKVSFFCVDNHNSTGTKIDGIPVISERELINSYADYIVILARTAFLSDDYRRLIRSGFPRRKILFPMHTYLIASYGVQYFDVFPPVKDEVFVDAGTYNCDTIKDFVKWTGGEYKRIYAFEPHPRLIPVIDEYIKDEKIKNVVFTPKATWNKKDEIRFIEDDSASKVGSEGRIYVSAIDIDSIVKDDRVTYIKMDVEGSELQALIGAQKTIELNKPRLAISVYHRLEDIIEIPEYILQLNMDYKLILRQYNSNMWETVLYCI